jgi:hypothetical protein
MRREAGFEFSWQRLVEQEPHRSNLSGKFERFHRVFAGDCGEVVKEIRQRVTTLEVVEQCLYRNAGSRENRSSVQDFRRGFDDGSLGSNHKWLRGRRR